MYSNDVGALDMFDDRTAQFEQFGISRTDIESVRAATTGMWVDGPGGWVLNGPGSAGNTPTWGEHRMASLVYGCAKFPRQHRRGAGAHLFDQR
jgi:esterase FrsA